MLKHVSKWQKNPWKPKKFIYEPTDEKLTASAGLGPLIDIFCASPQFLEFKKCLPEHVSNSSYSTEQLALTFLAGFWYGHDSLDDLEQFEDDPSVEEKLGGLATAKTFGNYLREFTDQNVSDLRQFLTRQAISCRRQVGHKGSMTIDMDSTFHEQSGKLMEGLEKNRDGLIGLDSLLVFDERGYAYDMELRSGATFSSEGAATMLSKVSSELYDRLMVQHYIRMDSAFCREDFIRVALSKNLKGTITAHGNTKWMEYLHEVTNWKPWVYADEEILEAKRKDKKLPQVDVGYWMYEPGWAPGVMFPIVIKRTFKEQEQSSLFEDSQYKYWGVLSLMGIYPKTPQEILEFHQGRGNMENFIREGKINYDLKHFPCQSLRANHVYGLLALVAHNFLRAIAHLTNPEKPHFAKKLRQRLIYLPGKYLERSRQLTMRIPVQYYKEVQTMLERWAATSDPPRLPA